MYIEQTERVRSPRVRLRPSCVSFKTVYVGTVLTVTGQDDNRPVTRLAVCQLSFLHEHFAIAFFIVPIFFVLTPLGSDRCTTYCTVYCIVRGTGFRREPVRLYISAADGVIIIRTGRSREKRVT